MSNRFGILFTLRASHGFYGGVCKDLGFVVPRETARRMSGVKLISRVMDGVLYVLFAAGEGGSPEVSAAGMTLRIGLKPLKPDFANFTELEFDPKSATALFRNQAAAGELDDPVYPALAGRVLVHPLSDADRPVTVTVKDAAGAALRSETVTAANDRSAVSFDLTGVPAGFCTVEEEYPEDVSTTTDYYLDPELRQEGVLCLLEIRIDSAFYAAPPAFEIAFDARREILKYYLVVRNYTSTELDQLNVSDAGFTEDGRPEVTFARVPAAAFTPDEIPASFLGNGDVILFKSQALVSRQAKGRRKIQLIRNGDVLVEHLPQAGAGRADANLIVHVSKP